MSTPLELKSTAGQDGLLFYTADVFTDTRFGGNPLAVFPQAAGLTTEQMQQIAREFNLSETVFVLPPQDPAHTCQVRIFTPSVEIPFAGHPTIGTAFVLTAIGQVPLTGNQTHLVLEEGVGNIPVTIFATQGNPQTAQLSAAQLPEVGPEPPAIATLAEILSLHPDDIVTGDYSPQALSCGLPFLFVTVRDLAALAKSRVNLAVWEQHLAPFWAPHLYVLTFDTAGLDADLRSRMFAPAVGVTEDPATGSAATALGGYLGARSPVRAGQEQWRVAQGIEMGRPSQLSVEIDKYDGEITAVRVGGGSVLMSSGQIWLA